MAMNVREACEKGTETFKAHDVDGSADVLADEVVFQAPGGMSGQGKAACLEFYGSWFVAFPDAHVEINDLHILDDAGVEQGTLTGTHNRVLHSPARDIPATGRSSRDLLHIKSGPRREGA